MTTDHGLPTTDYDPRLHTLAVVNACAAFVLLALGSLVTTFRVGMVDPIWPTYPWHLLLVSWTEPRPGFLIEHSHRLAGYVVGLCSIIVAVGLWRWASRPVLRWLGTAALLLVVVQGLLGGFRVRLNQWLGTDLALVHGSFAPVVFSVLVSLAVVTSRGWARAQGRPAAAAGSRRLRVATLVMAGLALLQIIFGGLLRHTYSPLGQRGHLLTASAVVAASVWVLKDVLDAPGGSRRLRVVAWHLAGLVVLQLGLGVEAWMMRYFAPAALPAQVVIKTAHVLTGWSILATAVVLTLEAYHRVAVAMPAVAARGRLEGAA